MFLYRVIILATLPLFVQGALSQPVLRKQGTATHLILNGRPFLILGGELHNSTPSSLTYMEPVWQRMVDLNVNTVLAGLSWELIEPEEGRFDFTLVDGLITDCGKRAAMEGNDLGWFDMSTLKEPYRLEGKKTMGYELAEQFGWTLPDVIIYPTGGGTGLVGMWKAFDEMERLGWIGPARPRMVTVQSNGCAPMVKAFHKGSEFAEPWPDASTLADGLRVPAAVGDFLILRALRESSGTALAVSDEEMMADVALMGRTQGMFTCPEGAAPLTAFHHLRAQGWIGEHETVVLFNTGSGLKYTHLW